MWTARSWRNSKTFAEHTNLNVTSVTELHVNGAVLNHINSVNTSNINNQCDHCHKNHPKNYFTEQNKPCSIVKQRQRHLRIENNFPIVKRIWQINICSHLPKPHHITHFQSWPVLTRGLVTFPGPEWYSRPLLFSISLYRRSCALSSYSWISHGR